MRAAIVLLAILMTGCSSTAFWDGYHRQQGDTAMMEFNYEDQQFYWVRGVNQDCATYWLEFERGQEHDSYQRMIHKLSERVHDYCYRPPAADTSDSPLHDTLDKMYRRPVEIIVYDGGYKY